MSLHLSKLHCSLKGKEMWNTSFLCFMNRNAETKKVIKLSQPTQEGRGRTKHAGSKQRHEESQQQLVRLPLWRVGPSLHLQCGDSHFLGTMFIYFILFFSQWIIFGIMWPWLKPPTHSSSAFCEKWCPLGMTLNCLIADVNVQWAAMNACIFESKDVYQTQFGFLFS